MVRIYDIIYRVILMENFFKYYTEIEQMTNPLKTFSFQHLMLLVITFVFIGILYKKYSSISEEKQRTFMKWFAVYYFLEEAIYYTWIVFHCHCSDLWLQLLPLELCTLCVYMNIASVFTKSKTIRFFSMVTGMIAGSIAMIYPANITEIYPVFSYRTINFYMLHGSFVLFSLLQLKDQSLLQKYYLKRSYFIICGMFTVAFIVNVMLDTQYMFVGIPPEIGIIASVYQITGVMFFLPVVYVVLFLFQGLTYLVMKKVSLHKEVRCDSL